VTKDESPTEPFDALTELLLEALNELQHAEYGMALISVQAAIGVRRLELKMREPSRPN
jgi:hypothetical protein